MRWKNWRVWQQAVGSTMPTVKTFVTPSATLLGLLFSAAYAMAATVTLTANDPLGYSSFDTPGSWSNGAAPSAGNAYIVSVAILRTPPSGGNYTFGGDSLTINGGSLIFKGNNGDVITIHNLTLASGYVGNGAGGGPTFTLAGNITLGAGGGTFDTGLSNRGIIVTATISGGGGLTIIDGGKVTLSAANSYSGGTTINSTILQLNNDNAVQNSTVTLNMDNGLTFGSGIGSFNLGGLAGSNLVNLADTASNPVTLNVGGNGQTTTFGGRLAGAGGLTMFGSGMLTLSGNNTYIGTTTVNAGTLLAGAVNTLSANSGMIVSGGTLDVSGFANTVASLNVASGGLNLGLGNTLTSDGSANLAGSLNVSGVGTLGDYPLLTYSSKSGSFASTTLDPNYGLLYNNDGTELDALHKAQVANLTVTPSNASVITGGSTSLIVNVSNLAPANSDVLNLMVSASGVGYGLSTTGSLAATNSGNFTIASGFNSTSFLAGSYTGTVTVTGTNGALGGLALGSGSAQTVTVTVLDHSNASLSSTATQTAQTINFGNVLKGANVPSQNFTVYNRAANTVAAYTAALNLTGFSATGDTALTTTLLPFGGLSAGGYVTYTTSLNTSNDTTTGIKTVTMSASQLVDASSLPGAGNNNNGALTITLQGDVGNATADASNSQTSFGTALTAPVAQNASYANLASTVTATTGSGGQGMFGSTATILAGTASVSTTASMAWRTGASSEHFASDVLDLSGIGVVDGETKDGSVHTDTFVLQMNYSPLAVEAGTGLSELGAAEAGLIQMDYLDEGPDNQWENAVFGNLGSSNDHFVGVGTWSGDTTLGDWGVNASNHTVWAVLDHNSQFAVTPEPSTLTLLAAAGAVGVISLADCRLARRRKRQLAAEPTKSSPDEVSATLSFPAQPSRWTEVKRRAA